MFFLRLVLGHFIGDWMFQTQWMASNKYKVGSVGTVACLTHTSIYSITLLLFMISPGFIPDPVFTYSEVTGLFGVIFVSHYMIDRIGLGERWAKLLGRNALLVSNTTVTKTLYVLICIVIDHTMHFGLLMLLLRILCPGILPMDPRG